MKAAIENFKVCLYYKNQKKKTTKLEWKDKVSDCFWTAQKTIRLINNFLFCNY